MTTRAEGAEDKPPFESRRDSRNSRRPRPKSCYAMVPVPVPAGDLRQELDMRRKASDTRRASDMKHGLYLRKESDMRRKLDLRNELDMRRDLRCEADTSQDSDLRLELDLRRDLDLRQELDMRRQLEAHWDVDLRKELDMRHRDELDLQQGVHCTPDVREEAKDKFDTSHKVVKAKFRSHWTKVRRSGKNRGFWARYKSPNHAATAHDNSSSSSSPYRDHGFDARIHRPPEATPAEASLHDVNWWEPKPNSSTHLRRAKQELYSGVAFWSEHDFTVDPDASFEHFSMDTAMQEKDERLHFSSLPSPSSSSGGSHLALDDVADKLGEIRDAEERERRSDRANLFEDSNFFPNRMRAKDFWIHFDPTFAQSDPLHCKEKKEIELRPASVGNQLIVKDSNEVFEAQVMAFLTEMRKNFDQNLSSENQDRDIQDALSFETFPAGETNLQGGNKVPNREDNNNSAHSMHAKSIHGCGRAASGSNESIFLPNQGEIGPGPCASQAIKIEAMDESVVTSLYSQSRMMSTLDTRSADDNYAVNHDLCVSPNLTGCKPEKGRDDSACCLEKLSSLESKPPEILMPQDLKELVNEVPLIHGFRSGSPTPATLNTEQGSSYLSESSVGDASYHRKLNIASGADESIDSESVSFQLKICTHNSSGNLKSIESCAIVKVKPSSESVSIKASSKTDECRKRKKIQRPLKTISPLKTRSMRRNEQNSNEVQSSCSDKRKLKQKTPSKQKGKCLKSKVKTEITPSKNKIKELKIKILSTKTTKIKRKK